jgi:hypothetical protein
MTLQQITASDISSWDSLQDIADSFEKRGLKPRPNLGEDHELVLQLDDDEFVTIVEGGPGESATDFKPENRTRHTNLVATNDYENFTFITRVRSWEGQQHGRIKHQKLSFSKEQFQRESGEKNTILQKLNSIEYGSSAAIYDTLYDTRQVVKEFYQQFESLRTDLVQEVSGIPDDRGDAKQRYVQVLLDRMIFLYFIQEKRLLDRNPDYLHEQPAKVVDDGDDRYTEFYEPLFFDYIAEDKQNPEFGKLPYLNGGLFAKNPVEEEFEDAKLGDTAGETNELFDDILDFLSDWNWNVDERLDIVDPKNLSPAVLGHIFEQTVNQKEMGAYYTPEEITGFMARRTVHPYLLDQLNEAVSASYDEIDDVFGFSDIDASGESEALADGGMVTQQAPTENMNVGHVETLYHDILKEAKLLDPAVGSGAFLLAGQEVLLDLYMQCIEFFQRLEDEGKGWELSSRTRDELDTIASGKGSPSLYAKRTIILNNLYGVDIDEGAVEICKLRLWLSMVADIEDEPGEVEPLPNIDFNIRQGNSLIGFTELMEVNQDGDAPLSNFGGGIGDSVREKYEDIIDAVEKHRGADTATEATNWRKEAERRLSKYEDDLNKKVLEDFRDAGVEDITQEEIEDHSPFHWVLEFASVYADGGFDVIIGNPPWDVVAPNREDYFTKFDEVFRQRGPSDKDEKQEELLEDSTVRKGWEDYQSEMETRASYFNTSSQYRLQDPEVDGNTVGNENDLSMLFFERVFELASSNSYVAQILPGTVFVSAAGKDLRMNLLNSTTVNDLVLFQNEGIFEGLHRQYKFGVVTFKNDGSTDELKSIYRRGDTGILLDIDHSAITVSREILTQYSPKAGIFPLIESNAQVDVLEKIIEHPPLSDASKGWKVNPYRELDRNQDRDRYVESEDEGDYPVYGGSNIYQYNYTPDFITDLDSPTLWSVDEDRDPDKSAKRRIREKAFRSRDPDMGLKKAIYNEFDGTGSQKGFVNDLLEQERGKPLSLDDVKLDCTEYRIVFRNITNSTNERTMICSVIPKGIVSHHAINTIRPYTFDITREKLSDDPLHSMYERVFSDRELFVALGLMNSIPFDFLMRTKIEENLVMYKLTESQVPRLTEGDDWFGYISERAARLNCYGDAFEEMRERLGGVDVVTDTKKRNEMRAEIDAAAFHAYGLTRRDVEFVLDSFHRVNSPRIMTEDYFDMVFEKYDLLKQQGPQP